MELAYVRATQTTGATGDELISVTAEAIPVFEGARDERSLGRAWLLTGWVHGSRRAQHAIRAEAAERALAHYKRSTWPTSTCVGEIAQALYLGPTPVHEAIRRCETLISEEAPDRYGRANIDTYLGGLVAQAGRFDEAHRLIDSARAAYDDLGQRASAATFARAILGDVQLLACDLEEAESTFRWLCNELARTQAHSHLASRAGNLADVLYLRDQLEEAQQWTEVAEAHSAADDIDALILWMPVRAKLLMRFGSIDEAVEVGMEAVGLAATGDALNYEAKAQCDLGEILAAAGLGDRAQKAFTTAIDLYEHKANIVRIEAVRSTMRASAFV
jgi:tetratricopeptide (TPR) repeat protein